MKTTTEKMKTLKVIRTTVHLGDIPLEVFQGVDKFYRLSQTGVASSVDKQECEVRRFSKSKTPQISSGKKDLNFCKGKVDGESTIVTLATIEFAAAYWMKEANEGNCKAISLLYACAVESIERRADRAFGIQRTESEYNQRFAVRLNLRKDKFRQLTTAIKEWEEQRGIYNTIEGKRWFQEAHDRMNIRLQNLRSGDIKAFNNLADSALIRDYFDVPVLVDYSAITQLAANFLRQGGINPVEAVDRACDFYLVSSYTPKPARLLESIDAMHRRLKTMKQQT